MRKLLVRFLYIEISLSKRSLILYRISEVNDVYVGISCTARMSYEESTYSIDDITSLALHSVYSQ